MLHIDYNFVYIFKHKLTLIDWNLDISAFFVFVQRTLSSVYEYSLFTNDVMATNNPNPIIIQTPFFCYDTFKVHSSSKIEIK